MLNNELLNNIREYININISMDIPLPWGMYFQDGMSAISNGIVELHGYLFYYLVFILCGVTYILFAIIVDKRSFAYKYVTHHTGLEVIWTAIPIMILGMIGIPSLDLLYLSDISATERPFEPVSVKVIGNQWYWTYNYNFDASVVYEDAKFWEYVRTYTSEEDQNKIYTALENNELKLDNNITYEYDSYLVPTSDLEDGQLRLLEVDNKLYIPLDEPIKFLITASDVIHDFAVPALGIKIDCNPGRLNSITVKSNRIGVAYGQCSELCGVGHSEMPIAVHTLTSYEWSNFMYYHTLKNLLDNINS